MSKNKRTNETVSTNEIKDPKIKDVVRSFTDFGETVNDEEENLLEKKDDAEIQSPEIITKKTTCRVNLRRAKTKNSDVVKILEKDTEVNGLDKGDWFEVVDIIRETNPGVKVQEMWSGYIMSEFLK